LVCPARAAEKRLEYILAIGVIQPDSLIEDSYFKVDLVFLTADLPNFHRYLIKVVRKLDSVAD